MGGGDGQKPTTDAKEPRHHLPPPNSRIPSSEAASSRGGQKPQFPNPPETVNPDAATLRDQWKFATRQYSKWYAHAWGTAILAGASFFALGWVIKGSNPLHSFKKEAHDSPPRDFPEVDQAR